MADGGPKSRRHQAAGAVLCALVVLGGCSFVPDAANPVEWFKGVRNWAGDRKTDAQLQAEEASESLPMPNQDAPFPNLATVPERPSQYYEPPPTEIQRSLQEDRREAIEADDEVRSRPADFGMAPAIAPATRKPIRRTNEDGRGPPPESGPTAPRLPKRERPPPPPVIPDPPLLQPNQSSWLSGSAGRVPRAGIFHENTYEGVRFSAQDLIRSDGPRDA